MNKQNKDIDSDSELNDDSIQKIHDELLNEKELPKEGFSFLPIFLIFAFAGICFWGGIYIVNHGGAFRWDAYDPDFVVHDKPLAIPEKSLFEIGQKLFVSQCAQCHQANGQGVTGVYPPLVASNWVLGHQEVLARILINGMNGKVEVLGKTYNGNMPAFGPSGLNLKPKQIAGVLTYIRQEWGNDSSDVTEETMKNYIAQYANRTAPWTAEELLRNLSPEPLAPIIDESSDIIESQGESHDSSAHGGHTKTSFQSGKEQNNI
jgi:mono/diheme cytochrome c family protein